LDWGAIPAGTRVTMSRAQAENAQEGLEALTASRSAADIAGDEVRGSTTVYFLKDGRVRQGNELSAAQVKALPVGTQMLVGYIYGGYVTAQRPVYKICGEKWRDPATVYRLPGGRMLRGNEVTEGTIPPRAIVFFRK
jgi:protein-disulfide isomerase